VPCFALRLSLAADHSGCCRISRHAHAWPAWRSRQHIADNS
jgi:hypothetical protein